MYYSNNKFPLPIDARARPAVSWLPVYLARSRCFFLAWQWIYRTQKSNQSTHTQSRHLKQHHHRRRQQNEKNRIKCQQQQQYKKTQLNRNGQKSELDKIMKMEKMSPSYNMTKINRREVFNIRNSYCIYMGTKWRYQQKIGGAVEGRVLGAQWEMRTKNNIFQTDYTWMSRTFVFHILTT